jgi:hypothetical protein
MRTQTIRRRPLTSELEVANFIGLLGNGWASARSIEQFTGWDERKIRALAEGSQGRVISGQRGYKLTAHATDQEVANCRRALTSQARRMNARARQIVAVRKAA